MLALSTQDILIESNPGFCLISIYSAFVFPGVWANCIGFRLNLICHHGQKTDQTHISRSKTNAQSSSGPLLVIPAASSGSIHWMESTPNKVSQQRARACAERCISRLNSTWSKAKSFSCSLQSVLHNINECQLSLRFTIRNFIFGLGSITYKKVFAGSSCERRLIDHFFFAVLFCIRDEGIQLLGAIISSSCGTLAKKC